VRVNGLTGLVLTKLDVLTGIDPLPVATTYSGPEGAKFEDFPYHQSVLHHVRGETVEMPGWEEDLSGARSLEDLPQAARDYIRLIEDQLGIPVVTIGVGPGREEIIWTPAADELRAAAAA
jgi:adenylosuccinate synthase